MDGVLLENRPGSKADLKFYILNPNTNHPNDGEPGVFISQYMGMEEEKGKRDEKEREAPCITT